MLDKSEEEVIYECVACKGTGYYDKRNRFLCPQCGYLCINDAYQKIICECGYEMDVE